MKLGLPVQVALGLISVPALLNAQQITVRVADYAGLSRVIRDDLRANATRILRQAGFAVDFIDCFIAGGETGAAVCRDLPGPADFVLRIFPPRFAMNARQLGYAATEVGNGAYATVFLDPNRMAERVHGLSEGTLLGHNAVHEIGHLLLGANSHSSSGIMRPVIREVDEEWMAGGFLLFSADQARRMRASLLARLSHETRIQNAYAKQLPK